MHKLRPTFSFKPIREMQVYSKPNMVFNKVDSYSRKLFPLTFILVNIVYWYGYMYLLGGVWDTGVEMPHD
jgi:hypothetical protein